MNTEFLLRIKFSEAKVVGAVRKAEVGNPAYRHQRVFKLLHLVCLTKHLQLLLLPISKKPRKRHPVLSFVDAFSSKARNRFEKECFILVISVLSKQKTA